MDSVCHGTFQGMVTDYEQWGLAVNCKYESHFHTSKLLGYGSCTLYAHGFMMVKEVTQGETYILFYLL